MHDLGESTVTAATSGLFRQMCCWIRRCETSVPCPLGLTPSSGVCKHITSQAEGCSNSDCTVTFVADPSVVISPDVSWVSRPCAWTPCPSDEALLHQSWFSTNSHAQKHPHHAACGLCTVQAAGIGSSNPPALQAQESVAQRSLGTAQVWKQGSSPGRAVPTFPWNNGEHACTQREGRKGFGFGGSSRIEHQV